MKQLIPVLILVLGLAGCQTRPISDTAYRPANYLTGQTGKSVHQRAKEIPEADVIGVNRAEKVTEKEIKEAFSKTHEFKVPKQSTIFLMQAGSTIPEQAMLQVLGRHFKVVPASGLPLGSEAGASPAPNAEQAAKALRLEAARAGAGTLLCYWGNLEIAKEDLPTKTISWLPVLDVILPDEAQDLRLRLKFALVDVRSGQWTVFNAQPYEAKGAGTAYARAHADQYQLNAIKKRAYEQAIDQVLSNYATP